MATFPLQYRNLELEAHIARLEARIERETADTSTTSETEGATAGGDERKLRGIPAIGRSVAGAIPGTNPDQATREPL